MEEEFYASVKLVSGEEIFGEVMPSEENGRTVLIISDPVEIETVSMDGRHEGCLLYTSPSPRDLSTSRMPSSA